MPTCWFYKDVLTYLKERTTNFLYNKYNSINFTPNALTMSLVGSDQCSDGYNASRELVARLIVREIHPIYTTHMLPGDSHLQEFVTFY